MIFWGTDGWTAKHNREYEEAIAIIAHSDSRNPKEMTILEYYTTLETMKKRNSHA